MSMQQAKQHWTEEKNEEKNKNNPQLQTIHAFLFVLATKKIF